MNIRQQYEENEFRYLSPYAVKSRDNRGRILPIEACSIRTDFQRDRDRIIHSKAFRRLKHKTQVFIAPEGDHYRTRLTHTLEVSQIARTIARALRLNEDLTEAIALGHDLGHTPFGHAGEKALDEVYPGGFKHNEQSLRVVDILEGNKGLNLTWEVRDGIVCHTGDAEPSTLEGMVVRLSDRVAYINHDIDDALRAAIIRLDQLPADCLDVLGKGYSQRINAMVVDIINSSMDAPVISMSPEVSRVMNKLRDYLFEQVYLGPLALQEENKVKYIVKKIYQLLLEKPELLPDESQIIVETQGLERACLDFVAGMTDQYAIRFFSEHFVPLPWAEL
ncbi:MAG: deoxyguanosinetriphosphate triphosphohydrolase [Chitinophagales bacterium]